jgi:hypothetical protein
MGSNGLDGATADWADRIPSPAAQRSLITWRWAHLTASLTPIESLPIDGPRRCEHDPHWPLTSHESLQQACRAPVIRIDVALDFVHRLPDASFRGEMDDRIDVHQHRGETRGVTDIPMNKLGASKFWRRRR